MKGFDIHTKTLFGRLPISVKEKDNITILKYSNVSITLNKNGRVIDVKKGK